MPYILDLVYPSFNANPDCAALAVDGLLASGTEQALALLDKTNNIGGIAGDPGWSIDARKSGPIEEEELWPAKAKFRISVEPDLVEPASSEVFLTDEQFFDYLRKFWLAQGYPLEVLEAVEQEWNV
jgi:hypothetical protein